MAKAIKTSELWNNSNTECIIKRFGKTGIDLIAGPEISHAVVVKVDPIND